jgi:hypothetical protein
MDSKNSLKYGRNTCSISNVCKVFILHSLDASGINGLRLDYRCSLSGQSIIYMRPKQPVEQYAFKDNYFLPG